MVINYEQWQAHKRAELGKKQAAQRTKRSKLIRTVLIVIAVLVFLSIIMGSLWLALGLIFMGCLAAIPNILEILFIGTFFDDHNH
ncbi:hypothetical protein M3M35_05750 [Fructilactobacillus myrtifloralis]|uniref:Uncharacterized protein n=1 Tax=Fructilactobacillus myrtifloralis TaxID=2940301 RepID=A0ABY5BMA0_9LACO|nr:hypothetical protein [Fructilactobacillus myrtifloralis]USS84809.1 hypothetical protein M3M35_05750 [Fructilactobacillus myrtifloralis]